MRRWLGLAIGGWVVLFLAFDGAVKLLRLDVAVEGTTRLGYPEHLVVIIGLVELACLLVYVIPRTAPLGALLLTGYLGGATATQVRVEDPWFLFPVVVGVLVWVGLFLRDVRLRPLYPLKTGALVRIGVVVCVLLIVVVVIVSLQSGDRHYAKLRNPDLEYLKAVNSV